MTYRIIVLVSDKKYGPSQASPGRRTLRVLVIESSSATAQSIELLLKSEGMCPYSTDLGEEGVDLARRYDYDAIVLDMTLQDMTGLEVLRRIRTSKVVSPILTLSDSIEVETRVTALNSGADDALYMPFHQDELVCAL